MQTQVLKSELAGMWYPDDPEELAREIDIYLAAVESGPANQVMALLLPHAGYRYSGLVAAHGVKQIEGHFAILASPHQAITEFADEDF